MANKHRCTYCREYFEPEDMLARGVGGVCSLECLRALQERARQKRLRRRAHKDARKLHHGPGRRIPGPERKKARARDGVRCRWCGTPRNLNLHHVIYRSEGGPDRSYNLLTLCRMHHEEVHSDKGKYQPALLHMLLHDEDTLLTVPYVIVTITPTQIDEAIKWGRGMRHGLVA